MPPPLKRRQTEYESPLYKEGGTARIAVTGDCLNAGIRTGQSSVMLTHDTSFLKEAYVRGALRGKVCYSVFTLRHMK